MTGPLAGRVVIVTGAGSGIGRGISTAVADDGARVVVTDLDGERARETAATLAGGGAECCALNLDVTDEAAITRVLDTIFERYGRLDGWVSNAGALRMAAAIDTDDADWRLHFDVNARALFHGCRLAAGRLIDQGQGGAIVNVASNAAKVGYPNMSLYNASKAAVVSITRSLAAEWAPHGINVNAVCPGGVDTPMLAEVARWVGEREGIDPEALLATMVPAQLARHIQPIEIGRVVAFLLSDRAAIIRGQSINVDGGDTPY